MSAVFYIFAINGCRSNPATVDVVNPLTNPLDGLPAGNPEGAALIPADAGLENISNPDRIVGTGTPQSCTSKAFIDAVAKGGTIVFNGGIVPFTSERLWRSDLFCQQ